MTQWYSKSNSSNNLTEPSPWKHLPNEPKAYAWLKCTTMFIKSSFLHSLITCFLSCLKHLRTMKNETQCYLSMTWPTQYHYSSMIKHPAPGHNTLTSSQQLRTYYMYISFLFSGNVQHRANNGICDSCPLIHPTQPRAGSNSPLFHLTPHHHKGLLVWKQVYTYNPPLLQAIKFLI